MINIELIISLIKDDLRNNKLINGLNKIGLKADDYYLHLSDTIFNLMGFEDNSQTDALIEYYYEYSNKVEECDFSLNSTQLDEMAEEVFERLSSIKTDHIYNKHQNI
ncbi:MAG: hypothetical protein HYR91_15535 [Flavobacteriia bacterium]|nr:hypothetical protein [Flavobacteriia bacterium]